MVAHNGTVYADLVKGKFRRSLAKCRYVLGVNADSEAGEEKENALDTRIKIFLFYTMIVHSVIVHDGCHRVL